MRRAAKTDDNQADVVEALRKIGASVYYIKEPVDLLVGYRRRTVALEVKREGSFDLTEQQRKFFREFSGEAYIVQSVAEAISAVTGKVSQGTQ